MRKVQMRPGPVQFVAVKVGIVLLVPGSAGKCSIRHHAGSQNTEDTKNGQHVVTPYHHCGKR